MDRNPLSVIDMNKQGSMSAAKRRLTLEEKEEKHMQIDKVMAKKCKRKQTSENGSEAEVMEASLNWSPKST